NQAVIWQTATGGPILAAPVASGDGKLLLVGSLDGTMYAFNSTTGATIWTDAVGPVSAAVSIGEGISSEMTSAYQEEAYVSSVNRKDGPGIFLPMLINASMKFAPAVRPGYNFYFDWSYTNILPGRYLAVVFVQDAHNKSTSNDPRCCGFVHFNQAFEITPDTV